ncbi:MULTISPECIES: helix-turn-helix domain-containing protein [Pseudacidovorax]|uniref:helix-turn-helix domain-containing protein n=1 Tax=Pseudacidovorax TaxID=433923 RepID=UPI001F3EB2CF|nr:MULTISPECIES: helix-turn-helix transcriptional regulator [Pseudacidovorax]
MTKLKDLHGKWSKDPAYREAYDALEEEFALAEAIAEARAAAGLTQAEVAERMQTTQSNIARMEAGRSSPSTRTLEKFAHAIGARLKISFDPVRSR